MADEYVVRIVLDGVDNASDDIQRVDDELDNLGKSAAGANLDLAMFTGGMALTVGALNQFTGGLRKGHGAAERLGVGTQESRDQLAHYLDIIELIVGPLESILALFVMFGFGLGVVGSKAFATGAATIGLTSAASALGVSLTALVGIIVGVTAGVILLGAAFILYRDEIGEYAGKLRELLFVVDDIDRGLIRIINGINGVSDAISGTAGNIIDDFDTKMRRSIFGQGGSITRLA